MLLFKKKNTSKQINIYWRLLNVFLLGKKHVFDVNRFINILSKITSWVHHEIFSIWKNTNFSFLCWAWKLWVDKYFQLFFLWALFFYILSFKLVSSSKHVLKSFMIYIVNFLIDFYSLFWLLYSNFYSEKQQLVLDT